MSVTAGDSGVAARVRAAVEEMRRAQHEVRCAVTELDGSDLVAASNYRSTARLLQDLAHVDPATAKRWLAQGKAVAARPAMTGEPLLPGLPATAAAFTAGRIGEDHVRVIARTMDAVGRIPDLEPGRWDDAEEALAHAATTLAPHGVDRVARRLHAHLDPDGVAPLDPPALDDEMLVRPDRRDGSLGFSGRIHGAGDVELLTEVLDALSTPAGPDDARSLSQRRAAALMEIVHREAAAAGVRPGPSVGSEVQDGADDGVDDGAGSAAPDPDARTDDDPGLFTGPPRAAGRPLLAVTMDYTWLRLGVGHGLLDSGAAISPGEARRLACDAGIVPIVLGTAGQPLDVGRLSYVVPDGMRRALVVRDRGCTFPGCTRRPRRCHAHHVHHWVDDGVTEIDNLTLLCRFHHQLVHHGDWQVHMVRGRPWFTPPSWIDPHRTPRPGGPHPPDG